MYKIAVFGFAYADAVRPDAPRPADAPHSPLDPDVFMRHVWAIEPPESRIGAGRDAPCFVKLSKLTAQPVYVQRLSEEVAPGAGLLSFDGYVVLVDAVKILAPRALEQALRRVASLHPDADLVIAAGRQDEPGAMSEGDIRAVLGLHPDLPIFPYLPDDAQTVHDIMRQVVNFVDDPARSTPPIFADYQPSPPAPEPARDTAEGVAAVSAPPHDVAPPHISGLAHVAITVSDLERALDFYRGILGFRLLGHLDYPGDERGHSITYLEAGRGVIKLFTFANTGVHPAPPEDETRVGWQHIALTVTGMDAIVDQLKCAGVEFVREPLTGQSGATIAFLRDPDGTLIELIEGDLTFTRR